jgi:uncharacterized protein YkwD
MVSKRIFVILIIFILLAGLSAACSSEIKMVKRGPDGTSTLTPFAPKATFTKTAIYMDLAGEGFANEPTYTATMAPPLIDETSQVTITGEVSSTPSSASTSQKTLPGATPTLKQITPSATKKPAVPSATSKSTTSTPSVATETSKPSQPTNTPKAPTQTNTPKPPTETSTPTSTTAPVGCSFSGNTSYENQVVVLINQERTDRGLSELVQKSTLRQAARRHSEDMACNDFFSHTGSDGSTLSSRVLDAGYSYSWVAENIAASSSCSFSAQAVVSMWMNSTGHRKNMLSENAKHIGVGFRCAADNKSGDLDAYYTANFGRP